MWHADEEMPGWATVLLGFLAAFFFWAAAVVT